MARPVSPSPGLYRSSSTSSRTTSNADSAAFTYTKARGRRYLPGDLSAFESLSTVATCYNVPFTSAPRDYFDDLAPLSAGLSLHTSSGFSSLASTLRESLASPTKLASGSLNRSASESRRPPAHRRASSDAFSFQSGLSRSRSSSATSSVPSMVSSSSSSSVSSRQLSNARPLPSPGSVRSGHLAYSYGGSTSSNSQQAGTMQCERCPLAFPDMPSFWGAVATDEDGLVCSNGCKEPSMRRVKRVASRGGSRR